MRKPIIDNVEIVEPPIGELTKQSGSFKKTCLTGCGCVIFLIIGAIALLWLFVGKGPATIKQLPANFPADIPMYEKDSIETMTYISGTYKNRSTQIASFFPKLILSPLLLKLHSSDSATSSSFWKLLTSPVGDNRDTVEIEWRNMDAEPNFVVSYYKKELSKRGYEVSDIEKTGIIYQITFNRDDISGTIFTRSDDQDHAGTDYAYLTVNYP